MSEKESFNKIMDKVAEKTKKLSDARAKVQSKFEAGDFKDDQDTYNSIIQTLDSKEAKVAEIKNQALLNAGQQIDPVSGNIREAMSSLSYETYPRLAAFAQSLVGDEDYETAFKELQR